ncbi:mycothiol transferase [Allonocardiopsis opalescens]|uniref:Uncharacterized protein DUF664 n=1 Tax=Allonocardiopsis opalescens TaxID=1144618 RepID=A0A2T0Q2Z0_9ACTN|nr:DinB family protein [Allonocardiopsis opalescens]PRX98156.1 uncharacterized protein DUF664 [Allonocardiopsis opalescens]
MGASSDLLVDAFGRIQGVVHGVLDGVTGEELTARVDGGANTIAWLVWHLTRIQDDHVAGVAGRPQRWTDDGWYDRFDLPFPPRALGYGDSSADVAAVRDVAPELLRGYHDAVHDSTVAYLRTITDDDLARVVDKGWDPPVTLGVRLVSVVSDDLQHAGQAAFIRGVLRRR